ncbi:Rrf2 family transcriptional regulator [Candidatus Collierbacteria bacterium]|nr:Rrf2 family transcriptional regulator [Candidatus Collierbacteria bacterium]
MTQDVRYALLFLTEIVRQPWKGPVTVKKFANNHHLSFKFLEQIVGKLRQSGILWSVSGRSGGYGLKLQQFSVADIYHALGHEIQALSCSFPTDCRGGAECLQKEIEAKITGQMNDLFVGMVLPA